ncbi:MAG TPA: hypothetical protein VGH14_13125 [Solirubrobacterales bacterium]|jgi:hypothetical protein
MSILDDAIREHLELKRAHGADDAEVKRLEDEAFGPPQRPDEIDPFAEAPTEFLKSPGESAADVPEIGDEGERSGRRPDIADLQEPPQAPQEAAGPVFFDGAAPEVAPVEDEPSPTLDAPPPSPADAADVPLPPPPGGAPAADLAPPTDEAPAPPVAPAPAEDAPAPPTDEAPAPPTDEEFAPAEAPAVEEHPAGEHEVVVDADPTTEDPDAITDQPTQMFDVQAHVDAEAAAAPATGEQVSPTDEELVDAAQEEPQAAPPAAADAGPPTELYEQPPLESRGPDAEVAGHPPAEAEPEEGSAEFDFFNEQRLSEELDQALEAPLPPTDEHLAMPRFEDAPAPEDQGGIFDFESQRDEPQQEKPYEDDPSQEVLRRAEEAEGAEEPARDEEPAAAEEPGGDEEDDETEYDPETGHEDVLEDTPRFLEDAPEDDDLWFEQKPPKDFDLD